LDYQAEEASAHRLDSIADFYAARQSLATQPRSTAPLYRPVRPEQMFLDDAEWKERLRAGAVVRLSPFAVPDEGRADSFDAGARLTGLPPGQGFTSGRLTLLGEQDILGDRLARAPRRRRNLEDFISEAGALSSGDLVVHGEHGIGRYEGLETIDVAGAPHDCL